ncbi:MAG: carbohydrate ABC transporter permease [Balneolaceae bacterium]|nr:MAG: carbohydrate ABC transporter permease [Balneolaceae bacterium]
MGKKLILYIILSLLAVIFVMPFLWMLSTSLKADQQIFTMPPVWIPETIVWSNYLRVFEVMPFFTYLYNTTLITGLTILGSVLSGSLVAYAFGCLEWRGRDALFLLVLATMMLPMQVTMIPVFVLFKDLGWLNTIKPLTVPAFFGGAAFNIFLLRQFYMTIPKSLLDAARIDGCPEIRIWWSIVMPLAKPALATVAIMTFMFTWNDFLGPLIYLSDQAQGTLALGLASLVGQHQTDWSLLMAASLLMMLPIILLFFFFQRFFIQGFTMSGIKE